METAAGRSTMTWATMSKAEPSPHVLPRGGNTGPSLLAGTRRKVSFLWGKLKEKSQDFPPPKRVVLLLLCVFGGWVGYIYTTKKRLHFF